MTYEEALEYAKSYITLCGVPIDSKEATKCIVEALEKQIPKKHKMVDNVLYCSACESYHGRYGDIRIPVGSDYCPYCGQSIDWSENDD